MTVLHPWALLGLLIAAIPVLLHLVERHQPPEQSFPAVRYLEDATRDQRRRLRLRDLLLLLLRTALIVLLVLAAAGLRWRGSVPFGAHAPLAAVLIVDNSASSAAVIDGVPVLTALTRAATEVLGRATAADRVWLILADGVARPGTATELQQRLAATRSSSGRLDLGAAISAAERLLASSGRPGEVIVVTDAQQSAVTPAPSGMPVVVLRPRGPAPTNRAVSRLDPGVGPWTGTGGRVTVAVSATDSTPLPVRFGVVGGASRDLLVTPGVPVSEPLAVTASGWHVVEAAAPADEFRLDDVRRVAVRVAPPPAVSWDTSDRFLAAALTVLAGEGRVRPGSEVTVGRLGRGASLVQPPQDPALIGALNRALAARGAAWRYGAVVTEAARSDSVGLVGERLLVSRRIRLEPVGPVVRSDTLATVAGEPWIVASGDLVLLGSRLQPEWTELPVRAPFVPLLDALIARVARDLVAVPTAVAGAAVSLPGRVTRVIGPLGEVAVEGGAPWVPPAAGLYWLLAEGDTVAALSAMIDPRESALGRADDAHLGAVWPDAIVADLDGGPGRTFAVGGRGDLRVFLLLLAVAVAIAESLLAGRVGRPR